MKRTEGQLVAATVHKEQVCTRLKMAREAVGIGQAKLARSYGVAPNKWNQWEKGLHYPAPHIIARFCDDYGFSADWFYRGILAGVSVERADDLRRVAAEKSAA